jgi:hypothetical protein
MIGAAFGWWVGAVHALLALSWTAYVLFLPSFVAQVGLPASLVVWIVLLDQALFTVTDWASAVLADRVAQLWRRLGAAIAAAALLCGLLFVAMPWAAGSGSSGLLLAVVGCWAALSSVLRAPVLALLGNIGSATRQGWAVGLALGLVAVAGALGPLLTAWLRAHDPRWPFALASGALALAGLVAVRADAWPPAARIPVAEGTRGAPLLLTVALLWLAGLGFQWHTSLLANAAPLPWARAAWAPLFWAGFALGLLLSSRVLAASPLRLRAVAAALAIGAAAAPLALHATQQATFVPAQLLVGAAWGIVLHTGLSLALARSARQRLATPVGLVFSALALAALCRVAVVALKWQGAPLWTVLPSAAWLAAAFGFWWHPWRADAAASTARGVPGGRTAEGTARSD